MSVRCRVMGSHPRRLQALVRPWKLPAADFKKCGSLPFRQVERRALVLVQERVSSRIYFEGDFFFAAFSVSFCIASLKP